MKNSFYLSILFILILVSCVNEFQPKNFDGISNILVIEGTITQGETIIKLSRSKNIVGQEWAQDIYPTSVEMYVECSDGTKSSKAVYENKQYILSDVTLEAEKQYRLFLKLDGNEYVSEFLTPLFTPQIDSITCIKKGKGESAYICVNTTDALNQSHYFKWSYEENWEVWAPMFANVGYDFEEEEKLAWYELDTPINTYYCWGKETSKKIIIESTDRLSGNTIQDMKLIEIAPSDDKLSVLYHVHVYQNLIRKEAYDYFYNLQQNADESGGIFSTMPNEIKGNITCITDPSIPVIGYVEVSTTVEKERYVETSEELYEPVVYGEDEYPCESIITSSDGYLLLVPDFPYYGLLEEDSVINVVFTRPRTCVDCRTKYNASKNKPEFWPTPHQ